MTTPLFATCGISKHFGGLQALEDVDMEVHAGEIHSVIGPNGAGKTTLFNCITGIYAPTAGRVTFEDREISGLPPHLVSRRGLARTFQNIRLFKKMTALENVMVGCHGRSRVGWFGAILHWGPARREEARIMARAAITPPLADRP